MVCDSFDVVLGRFDVIGDIQRKVECNNECLSWSYVGDPFSRKWLVLIHSQFNVVNINTSPFGAS